ncbi:MAG: hypothetical protein IPI60_19940 [Saprospiraceae bacterium]|nr:hypothetical protein [Saprospiraceae bacterium]
MPYIFILLILTTCVTRENNPPAERQEQPDTITIAPAENQPSVDKNFLLGKYDPTTHEDFMIIPNDYASREGMLIQKKSGKLSKKCMQKLRNQVLI